MGSFDYNNYNVVGIVENIPASNHSYIHVIGYTDSYNYNIHRYSTPDDAKKVFSKKGRIFAYMFAQKNPNLSGHCIIMGVIPNEKPGEGLDEYVWDWSVDIVDLAPPVKKIAPDSISFNGQENYNLLSKYNLIDASNDTFIVSNGCIYLIKAHSVERLIKYWSFADLEVKCRDSVIVYNGNFYITGDLCENTGVADITTDEQLVDWYLKKVLKPRWNEFVTSQNFKLIESSVKEVLGSVNLDSSIYNARLKRLKTINTNIQLSFENLQDVSNNPWFANILQSAVARFKENYVSEVEIANNAELKNLKEEHDFAIEAEKERFNNAIKESNDQLSKAQAENDKKISDLKDQSTLLELEVQNLTNTIERKKVELENEEVKWKKIIEKKDSIIEDFGVIKDVLNIATSSSSIRSPRPSSNRDFVMTNTDIESDPAMYIQVFMKRLELTLQAYGADDSDAENTTSLLSKNNILVSNDMRVIQSIIYATGRCNCLYEYVTPKWNCFDDFWNNGLAYIIEQASNSPDTMHYLILRNMNLSYIPSYIQPIVDMDLGMFDMISLNGCKYPSNLRILGHINEDSLIPVSIYAIEHLGCSKKLKFIAKKPDFSALNLPTGYLTPGMLNDSQTKEIKSTTYVEDYISEDE